MALLVFGASSGTTFRSSCFTLIIRLQTLPVTRRTAVVNPGAKGRTRSTPGSLRGQVSTGRPGHLLHGFTKLADQVLPSAELGGVGALTAAELVHPFRWLG